MPMTPPAIVVLGSSMSVRDGTYRISRGCRRVVAEAERAAARLGSAVVVFSGWSPDGGLSEAAQMRALWRGPSEPELVVEETASTTAENAARALPLLLERGVTHALVVCTPLHVLRARWIFRDVLGRHGVTVEFHTARVAPTPGAVVWEIGALTAVGRQLRAARSELERV